MYLNLGKISMPDMPNVMMDDVAVTGKPTVTDKTNIACSSLIENSNHSIKCTITEQALIQLSTTTSQSTHLHAALVSMAKDDGNLFEDSKANQSLSLITITSGRACFCDRCSCSPLTLAALLFSGACFLLA